MSVGRLGVELRGRCYVSGEISGRTQSSGKPCEYDQPLAVGRVTIRVLEINAPGRVDLRQVLLDGGVFPPAASGEGTAS